VLLGSHWFSLALRSESRYRDCSPLFRSSVDLRDRDLVRCGYHLLVEQRVTLCSGRPKSVPELLT